MLLSPPAVPGMHLEEVDTPALLIDLDPFERNIARLAGAVAGTGVRLRPHAKTHKCAAIALRQMAAGAVGICCQKVSEAEALVYGGVPDVLISNQVVGARKIARLMALTGQARIAVCADDASNVAALDAAAVGAGLRLPVLVEVNVGMERCGVEPGDPVLALAGLIAASAGLRFAGLQAYHGSAQHVREYVERRAAVARAAALLRPTVELLRRNGLNPESITGSGTGTYAFEASSGLWNELQCGSYVFMDADYLKNRQEDGAPGSAFESSLFVYATVMSRPTRDRAILDAGLKALSVDSGLPRLADVAGTEYVGASDEHGKVMLREPGLDLPLGSKVRLIPGHCDPTVNLYDWYVCYRGDRVEAVWPVTARGAVL